MYTLIYTHKYVFIYRERQRENLQLSFNRSREKKELLSGILRIFLRVFKYPSITSSMKPIFTR